MSDSSTVGIGLAMRLGTAGVLGLGAPALAAAALVAAALVAAALVAAALDVRVTAG